MGVSSQAATELQLRFLPAYCWQLLPRLPLRPTLLSSMELIHMLLEFMELIHMPHMWFLPLVWSLATLSLLLLVAIRLLLDPLETLSTLQLSLTTARERLRLTLPLSMPDSPMLESTDTDIPMLMLPLLPMLSSLFS